MARALLAEEVDPRHIAAIISREVCSLTARAMALALAELPAAGESRLCLLVLGSAGRGESLLAMDQDNAMVLAPDAPTGEADDRLAKAAARMNTILHEIGVPLCKGGIMAGNADWRMDVPQWRRRISGWLQRTDPQDILNADIFFDALPVYGDLALGDELRDAAIAAAGESPAFLKLLAVSAAQVALPVGWFGRWRLDDGRMDLKKGGLMPVFSAARVLALQAGLRERATPARLEALRQRPGQPAALIDDVIEAHKVIMGIILRQQLIDIGQGTPPSSRVDPKSLRSFEADRLRWALQKVELVPNLLGDPVG